jgi:uncharacterized protein (TIGR03083 family)
VTNQQPTPLEALATSQRRLRDIVAPLDDASIAGAAYPTEWTVAQVLSHLGSGAVITQRRLQGELDAAAMPDDFAPSVWDEWNAKSPRAQVDDALAADAALVAAFEAVSVEDRAAFNFSMGPMSGNFDAFVGLRLNEHALHTWDVEVTFDQAATVPSHLAAFVVDNLTLIAGFTAKATPGELGTVAVATTDPVRRFTIDLTEDGATLTPSSDTTAPDLVLPAEALVRLVYGRLDRDHSPPIVGDPSLVDRLRSTFPGF